MLIETEEVILQDENDDYALICIGGIWKNFKESIPAPQATILTRAFNLIYLSDPDTLIPNILNEALIDETYDVSVQKLNIITLFTNALVDILGKLGCIVNKDNINLNCLEELCNIVSFFYDLQGYEDVIGLAGLLESQDIPPLNRFLLAMEKYLGENVSMDPYELILDDVSEVAVFTIRDGLKGDEPGIEIPPAIVRRIRANAELLLDTLAYKHIEREGGVGASIEGLMNFFKNDLSPLLESGATADQVQYAKEITALYLISDLNTDRIKDDLYEFLHPIITDHLALIGLDNLINKLDFN